MSLLISQRLLASSTQMLGVPPPPCDVENVNMANSLKPAPPLAANLPIELPKVPWPLHSRHRSVSPSVAGVEQALLDAPFAASLAWARELCWAKRLG